MRFLFSIFLSFWSKIPNHPTWRSLRVQRYLRDKLTQLPLSTHLHHLSTGHSTLLDLSKVPPPPLRRPDNDSFLLCHVVTCEQQRLLSSTSLSPRSLFSCSLPVQLYSHFCSHSCDWLDSHGLSPLLSHSGASVVAVENGYPCLFFFVITQIKIPMN